MDAHKTSVSSIQASSSHATANESRHTDDLDARHFPAACTSEEFALKEVAVAEENAWSSTSPAFSSSRDSAYNALSLQSSSHADSAQQGTSSAGEVKLSPSGAGEAVRRPRTTTLGSGLLVSTPVDVVCKTPETPATPVTPASPLHSACQLTTPSAPSQLPSASRVALLRTASAALPSQSVPSIPTNIANSAIPSASCSNPTSVQIPPVASCSKSTTYRERKPRNLKNLVLRKNASECLSKESVSFDRRAAAPLGQSVLHAPQMALTAEAASKAIAKVAKCRAPQTDRRVRSNSVPLLPTFSQKEPRKKQSCTAPRTAPKAPKASKASNPVAQFSVSTSQSAAPLLQHQLLALHDLHQPRPANVTSGIMSRSMSRRHARPSPSSVSLPSMAPPITKATLRELDLSEILRNSQLRHDVVFDSNLTFRPNYDGDRGKQKLEASARYWQAVSREITLGCRCTAYKSNGVLATCICGSSQLSTIALSTLISGRPVLDNCRPVLTAKPLPLASRMPSRIAPLVAELRAILLSLLPASRSVSEKQRASDMPTHDLITSVLDPAFIAQEVEHGVLDVASLARFLGHVLKTHCAPMRDEMVDIMVATVEDGAASMEGDAITQGLKLCFEVLELMKLDIANHQLRTLRPYLLETALEYEYNSRQEYAERKATPSFARTKAWLRLTKQSLSLRCDQPATATDLVREGLINLVFTPADSIKRRNSSSKAVSVPSASQVPEVLQLDLFRLQNFHSDIVDLNTVYMLLMLFREVTGAANISETDIETMRHEIWVLLNDSESSEPVVQLEPQPKSTSFGQQLLPSEPALSEAMKSIVLHVVNRANQLKAAGLRSQLSELPDAASMSFLTSWFANNLISTSSLYQELSSRLRKTLTTIMIEEFGVSAASGVLQNRFNWYEAADSDSEDEISRSATGSARFSMSCGRTARRADLSIPPSLVAQTRPRHGFKRQRDEDVESGGEDMPSAKRVCAKPESSVSRVDELLVRNGLKPLQTELRVLAERMAKVACFNIQAYEQLYKEIIPMSNATTL